MLTLHISEAEIKRLNYERYHNPNTIVQKRCHALYIKSQFSFTHEKIGRIVGIHKDTVTDYIRMFNEGKFEKRNQIGYETNRSKLDDYSEKLKECFEKTATYNK